MSLLNLLPQDCRILAGIANIHVAMISKPGHVHGENFGRARRGLQILPGAAMDARRRASAGNHEARDHEAQDIPQTEVLPFIRTANLLDAATNTAVGA